MLMHPIKNFTSNILIIINLYCPIVLRLAGTTPVRLASVSVSGVSTDWEAMAEAQNLTDGSAR